MQLRSDVKAFLVVLVVTVVALVGLIRFGVIEHVSYALEKGRMRAQRESLPTDQQLADLSRAGRTVAALVTPAVVSIETDRVVRIALGDRFASGDPDRSPVDRSKETSSDQTTDGNATHHPPIVTQSIGSGFIFDAANGYILTNAHVVDRAQQVRVFLPDDRQAVADVLGVDVEHDLAVLRIALDRLHQVELGDSRLAQVGDAVFAVGSPFGLRGTVTKGIISASNRRNVQIGGSLYLSLLQTDAVITPGSSGGPLVNMRGHVIGISTAMATDSGEYDGVGFAIPSALGTQLIPHLISGGPGELGVMVGTITLSYWRGQARSLDWPERYGVLVGEVEPGRAAHRAGIKVNDIIHHLNGTRIDTHDLLAQLTASTEPGTFVQLKIWRERNEIELDVEMGRKYAPRD